jgi:hypothetical protein
MSVLVKPEAAVTFVVAGSYDSWVGTDFSLNHDSCRQPQTYVKPEAAIKIF